MKLKFFLAFSFFIPLCATPSFCQNKPEQLVDILEFENLFFTRNTCNKSMKVDSLVLANKEKSFDSNRSISSPDFLSLDAEEQYVYAFSYPESYRQSCVAFFFSSVEKEKIFAHLPGVYEGFVMSDRQYSSLASVREESLGRVRQCADSTNYSLDQMRFVVRIDGFELIPSLMKKASLGPGYITNTYLLTTMCRLMRDSYPPFKKSSVYKSLYSPSAHQKNTQNRQGVFISFNRNNYNEIMNFAHDYYQWRIKQPSSFTKIPKGNHYLGSREHGLNPRDYVEVKSFKISKFEVTNQEFKIFVERTGYVTLAEQRKNGYTFSVGQNEYEWVIDSTANWRFPNGMKNGGIENKMDHPVTCISYVDAQAYCKWAGVRLPTIREWEVAARGGTNDKYFFGKSNSLIHGYANIWMTANHLQVLDGDTTVYTTPVGSYLPNPYGLYDIYGNVFEFCSDVPYPMQIDSNIAATRGGSWWCSKASCSYFNSVDIGRVQKEASFSNNGFRVVKK